MDPTLATTLRDMHVESMAFEHPQTLAVLEQALDDKLCFTPHDKSRPFNEVLYHIYQSGPWFADIIEQGKVSFDGGPAAAVPRTRGELKAACEAMHADFIKRIRAVGPAQLTAMIPFGSMPPLPAVSYLGWHVNHLVHHRGQLTMYLRLMGAKVPSIYGGSADFPFTG